MNFLQFNISYLHKGGDAPVPVVSPSIALCYEPTFPLNRFQ